LLTIFHLGLPQVRRGVRRARGAVDLGLAQHLPVAAVVLLDQLKAPSPFEEVAADQRLLDLVGQSVVARCTQLLDGSLQGQVTVPQRRWNP
jgi:hypothetical protein